MMDIVDYYRGVSDRIVTLVDTRRKKRREAKNNTRKNNLR